MLFGEGQYILKMLLAFVAVFGLLALALWLVRRFGGERLGNTSARGRQPRLAVVDNASVDGRRRLVLIRRDNVEHLLLIGGPTDVVIEPNILRAAGAPRELPTPRASAGGDTLPRPVPLNDGAMWPLQPEPAARIEPSLRPEPPDRVPRSASPVPEEASDWSEPPVPPSPQPGARDRRARAEPLAGLAEELSRRAVVTDNERPSPAPARPMPRREVRPRPQPASQSVAAGEAKSASTEQNLAEMAQRLEAALRRPPKADEARTEIEKSEAPEAAIEPPTVPVQSNRPPAAEPSKTSRPDTRVGRSEAKPAPNSLYDSLEQEMASLLGRKA
jgi:flagellar protein FliO/FliZ